MLLNYINKEMNNCDDLMQRQIFLDDKICHIVFLKSMINEELIARLVVEPIINNHSTNIDSIKNSILLCELEEIDNGEKCVKSLLENKVIVILDEKALSVNVEKYPQRAPSEPPTSSVIQGPREGFTEDYKVNITLLRRRFPTSAFKLETITIGKYTQTKVIVCYLDEVADKKLVKKIKDKLKKINVDGIIDSYNLVDYLQSNKKSLFKQVGLTEKPDILASKLLEGRVGIICNGSPIVLTLPFLYIEDVQNSNDYYTNSYYATFIRIIRAIGILVATVVPGVYLSLRLYHYKIVPLKYIITIANSTENLPFTPFIEILFILLLFQILYEVSLRLPHYLGLATSIVGALILGDTGVRAGLISPPSVIMIALSLIAIYTVPDQSPQFTVLRFVFIMAGGCLGLLGIVAIMIFVINYCNGLNDYGAPYLAPFSPNVRKDLKDGIKKETFSNMKSRPKSFYNKNKSRREK